MKIFLIYPYTNNDTEENVNTIPIPIGIYYVAAMLKEHHYEVEILDCHGMRNSIQTIENIFLERRPDIVGISILNINRYGGIEIAAIAKRLLPDVKVVFGGIGASFLWEHFLIHFPCVDYIVIGEGDYTFLYLVELIQRNKYDALESIEGIAFRKNHEIIRTPNRPFIDNLDELSIPAKYYTYNFLISSRGCFGKCKFCGSPAFWKRQVRFRSVDNFVDEIELLFRKGVKKFFISDDTFTYKKERVLEICQQIIKRELDIEWWAISRVDFVDEQIIYWMKRAGCIQISYGVESGAKSIRKVLNKNITDEQIKRAFEYTRKYGIIPRAYFIYGNPGESDETIQDSIDLMREIKPLAAAFFILGLFPGTQLYAQYISNSGLSDDIWLNRGSWINYYDTCDKISDSMIQAFGRSLKSAYHENIINDICSVDLADFTELYKGYSAFWIRLAENILEGLYGKEEFNRKEQIAEDLLRKALSYYPTVEAYFKLAKIEMSRGNRDKAYSILLDATRYFPEMREINQ